MKQLILIVMLAGLLALAELHAQKVYKDGEHYILDLTVAAGMPATSVTNTSKTAIYDNASAEISKRITNNRDNESINATVYEKLAISNVEPGAFLWVDAMNYCKNLVQDGHSDWRLPTQRELMLIYIFRPALENLGIKKFNIYSYSVSYTFYWSATEASSTSKAWGLSFGREFWYEHGNTTSLDKVNSERYVRCVREVQ